MGPTGEIMAPLGALTIEAAAEMFEEQARGLLAGGADVLWVETISAPDEFRAAALGIAPDRRALVRHDELRHRRADDDGADLGRHGGAGRPSCAHPPLAFGANCGVGASDLLRTVLGFRAAHPALPVIAKGNAGIPKFVDGHIHYDGTPELMADYAVLARDCGATIIGGCCGTTPAHLVAMRAALESDAAAGRRRISTPSPRGSAASPRPRTGSGEKGRRPRAPAAAG